jgi:hypothetical protein
VPSRAPVAFAAFAFAALAFVVFELPASVVIFLSVQPAKAAAQASNTSRAKLRRIKISSCRMQAR